MMDTVVDNRACFSCEQRRLIFSLFIIYVLVTLLIMSFYVFFGDYVSVSANIDKDFIIGFFFSSYAGLVGASVVILYLYLYGAGARSLCGKSGCGNVKVIDDV